MNAERLEIARQLVACKGWVWLPGMKLHEPGEDWRVSSVVHRYELRVSASRRREFTIKGTPLPDLDCDLTRLGVLVVVRRAWGDDRMVTSVHGDMGDHPSRCHWMVTTFDGRCGWDDEWWSGIHSTEIEALLAALEAAPGPCKFGSEQTP